MIINDTTTANDVEAWDSLTHLSLMNELEVEFKVEFTLDEISKSKCIGELVDAVLSVAPLALNDFLRDRSQISDG